MADRQRLKELWRPFGEAALPTDELRRRRAVSIAINDDGGISDESVSQALPWQPRDFDIAGSVSPGVNVAQQRRVRQPSQLLYVDASARTAPSGGSLVMNVVIAGGSAVQTIAIAAGATSGVAASNQYIPIPAGSLLQLDVIEDNGAAGVSVTTWLVPDSGGS